MAARFLLCIAFAVSGPSPPAAGQERITRFHADVAIAPDGRLVVTEQIDLRVDEPLARGLFRSVRTRSSGFLDVFPKLHPFEVEFVHHNGEDGPPRTRVKGSYTRIDLTVDDRPLAPGEHRFEIRYRIDFCLEHGTAADRLSWNVTGYEWDVPVDRASVAIHLPEIYAEADVALEARTGSRGAEGSDWRAHAGDERIRRLETTRTLAPGEGLVVEVSWPAGAVERRGAGLRGVLWATGPGQFFALAGTLAALGFLAIGWGLPRRRGPLGAREGGGAPPPGLSPAAAGHLVDMKFDVRLVTAALLSAAHKGHVQLVDGAFHVVAVQPAPGAATAELSADESYLRDRLLEGGRAVSLEAVNSAPTAEATREFREHLAREQEGALYQPRLPWFLGALGMGFTGMLFGALLSWRPPIAAFLLLWVTGWTLGVFLLGGRVRRAWRLLSSPEDSTPRGERLQHAAFLSAFSLPFFAGEAIGLFALVGAAGLLTALSLPLLVGALLHAGRRLTSPTPAGRRFLGELRDYEQWLRYELPRAVAAGDRKRGWAFLPLAPHLPYIVALGIAPEWTRWLKLDFPSLAADQVPEWYVGESFSPEGLIAAMNWGITSALRADGRE